METKTKVESGHPSDKLLGGPDSAHPIEDRVSKLLETIKSEVERGVSPTTERILNLEEKLTEEIKSLRDEWTKYLSAFSLPGSEDKEKGEEFMWVKAFRAIATNDWSGAGREKEILDQVTEQVRAMATTPDSAGGFVVPIEVLQSQIIELLRAESVVIESGARVLTNLRGSPVRIPRISGGTTAYWVTENDAVTVSQLTLQQMQMTPHILATLTPYSELLGEIGEGVEQMIREDQAMSMATKLDLAALKGTGALGEPIGLFNMSGMPTSAFTNTAPTYNELIDFVSKVRQANALRGNLGWIMSAYDMTAIEKILDASNQPLERRVLADGPSDRLLGYPYKASTQLAADDVVFGNWSDFIIAQWGGATIATTNALGFASMQNHIRTAIKTDTGCRHTASFCINT